MNIVLESLPKVRKRESNSLSERKLTIFLPGRSLPRWPLRWPRPMRLCWLAATTTSPMTWHAWWPNCLHRSMPSPVWICPRCCRKFPAPRREICWTGMCNKWRWQRNPQGIGIEDDSERDKAIREKERGRAEERGEIGTHLLKSERERERTKEEHEAELPHWNRTIIYIYTSQYSKMYSDIMSVCQCEVCALAWAESKAIQLYIQIQN